MVPFVAPQVGYDYLTRNSTTDFDRYGVDARIGVTDTLTADLSSTVTVTTQFGTGRDFYDNLGDCVTNVLQIQADHHGTRSAALTETLGDKAPAQDEDYHGPIVI